MTTSTLWSSETFDAADYAIVAGQTVELAVSEPINNNVFDSVRVSLIYEHTDPDAPGGSFSIGCVLESEDDDGRWHVIASQFSPHRYSGIATQRDVILEPIPNFDQGIEEVVFPVDREVARISRTQGKLPEGSFRARLLLVDQNPGADGFQSVTVSASVEQSSA